MNRKFVWLAVQLVRCHFCDPRASRSVTLAHRYSDTAYDAVYPSVYHIRQIVAVINCCILHRCVFNGIESASIASASKVSEFEVFESICIKSIYIERICIKVVERIWIERICIQVIQKFRIKKCLEGESFASNTLEVFENIESASKVKNTSRCSSASKVHRKCSNLFAVIRTSCIQMPHEVAPVIWFESDLNCGSDFHLISNFFSVQKRLTSVHGSTTSRFSMPLAKIWTLNFEATIGNHQLAILSNLKIETKIETERR